MLIKLTPEHDGFLSYLKKMDENDKKVLFFNHIISIIAFTSCNQKFILNTLKTTSVNKQFKMITNKLLGKIFK